MISTFFWVDTTNEIRLGMMRFEDLIPEDHSGNLLT